MNIVLFAGAGFSHDAGCPVTSDFAKITHVSDYRHGLRKNRQSSNPIPDETFRGLQAAWHHAHKSVPVEPADNFESVFCLIDFHSAIHPYWQIAYWKEINDGECKHVPAERGLKIDYVKKLFTRAIYHTFNNPHPELETKEEWPGKMEEIYRSAVQKLAKHNLTIVSTNYDLLAEQLLGEGKIRQICGWREVTSREMGTTAICKLHGSVNWFKKGKEITRVSVGSTKEKRNEMISHGWEPLIMPPTWRKTANDKDGFSDIWHAGAYALANADIVFIVGYSLPPTDLHLKYLLSTGLSGAFSRKRSREVHIINPDEESNDRMQSLICLINRAKGAKNKTCSRHRNVKEAHKKGAFDIV